MLKWEKIFEVLKVRFLLPVVLNSWTLAPHPPISSRLSSVWKLVCAAWISEWLKQMYDQWYSKKLGKTSGGSTLQLPFVDFWSHGLWVFFDTDTVPNRYNAKEIVPSYFLALRLVILLVLAVETITKSICLRWLIITNLWSNDFWVLLSN